MRLEYRIGLEEGPLRLGLERVEGGVAVHVVPLGSQQRVAAGVDGQRVRVVDAKIGDVLEL